MKQSNVPFKIVGRPHLRTYGLYLLLTDELIVISELTPESGDVLIPENTYTVNSTQSKLQLTMQQRKGLHIPQNLAGSISADGFDILFDRY